MPGKNQHSEDVSFSLFLVLLLTLLSVFLIECNCYLQHSVLQNLYCPIPVLQAAALM